MHLVIVSAPLGKKAWMLFDEMKGKVFDTYAALSDSVRRREIAWWNKLVREKKAKKFEHLYCRSLFIGYTGLSIDDFFGKEEEDDIDEG